MKPTALLVVLVTALASRGLRIRPAPPPPRPAAAAPRPGQPLAAGLLFGARLDLDAATDADLEALPGIGPERARRIVRHRAAHGPLRGVDGLSTVPGIGPRTIEALRRYVR